MKFLRTLSLEKILSHYTRLPHKLFVSYAVDCAEDAISTLRTPLHESVVKAIDLTKQWLKNPKSVTTQELTTAAAKTIRDAGYSAGAAYNAELGYACAMCAAYYVSKIIYAYNAAYYASAAANHRPQEYYRRLLIYKLERLPKIQIILYGIDR